MKLRSFFLSALSLIPLVASTAQANKIVSYLDTTGIARVSLYNDSGTVLQSYSDPSFTFTDVQRITTDSSGNVYVADTTPSGIFKFNIATGAYLGNIFTNLGYQLTGLGFNPNQPSQILYAGNALGGQQLGIINSTSGTLIAYFSGVGYTNVSYDSVSGKIVSALTTNGSSQKFNASTLAFEGTLDAPLSNPQTLVTIGGTRYYGTVDGKIRDQSNNLIYDFGATSDIYQLATDGSNLLATDLNTGIVSTVSTTGAFVSSFDVGNQARGIAFTTVPEPSTYALIGLSGLGLLAFRRRFRRA